MTATSKTLESPKVRRPREPSPFNLPNFLTATRFLLAMGMFFLISRQQWLLTGVLFALASITDWLDGWAARKLGIVSSFGRSFDPLVDKMLICGSYICLLPYPLKWTGLEPWMVVVVVTRELLVTSLRGYIESLGIPFGADKWGKVKMVLQCLALAMVLYCLLHNWLDDIMLPKHDWLELTRDMLLHAMVIATVFSGLQYLVTSYRMYKNYEKEQDRLAGS